MELRAERTISLAVVLVVKPIRSEPALSSFKGAFVMEERRRSWEKLGGVGRS